MTPRCIGCETGYCVTGLPNGYERHCECEGCGCRESGNSGEQDGAMSGKFIDIVFDGPPAPESGRFIEVEDEQGRSINAGEWIQRDDGYWALRIRQAGD